MLCAAMNAAGEAGNWDTFECGSWANTTSLPVDYEIVGILLGPISVGESVRMMRLSRNGVRALGIYRSTLVT